MYSASICNQASRRPFANQMSAFRAARGESHGACCTQWPPCFLGKGEHEPGDTASNSLASAWPSMCARQTQIMAPGRFCYSPRPFAISLFQPRLPLYALSLCCALIYLRPPRLCAVEPALQLHRGALSHGKVRATCPRLDLMDQRQLRLLVPRRLQLTICAEGSPYPSLSTRGYFLSTSALLS